MEETRRTEMFLDIVPRIVQMAGVAEFEGQMRRMRGLINDSTVAAGGSGAAGAAHRSGLLGAAGFASDIGIAGAAGLGAFGVIATREAIAVEGAANRIKAAHNLSKQDYAEYTRFINENSTKLLTEHQKLWEGIGQSVEHNWGVKGTEAVTAGAAKMAKVFNGDYSTTVKGVTGLLDGFKVKADQIPAALDSITAAMQRSGLGSQFLTTGAGRFLVQAQSIGASMPESLGLAAEIDKMGIGTRAVGAFGSLIQRLGALQHTKGYGGIVNIGQYGIEGSLANLLGQKWQTPEKLQKELGGGLSLTLAQRIVAGGPQGASLGDTQGALNQKFLQYSKSEAASLDKLRLSVKNLEEAFGKGLIPVVQTATEELTPLIGGIEHLVELNPQFAKHTLQAAVAVGGLSIAFKVLSGLFGPVASGATKAAEMVGRLSTATTETAVVATETAPKLTLVETGIAGIGTASERASGLLVPMNAEMGTLATTTTGMDVKLGAEATGINAIGTAAETSAGKLETMRGALFKMVPAFLAMGEAASIAESFLHAGNNPVSWLKTAVGYVADVETIFLQGPVGIALQKAGISVPTLRGIINQATNGWLNNNGGTVNVGGSGPVPARSGAGLNPNYSLFGMHYGAGDAFTNNTIGPTTSGIVNPTTGQWHTGAYHWDFGTSGSGNETVTLPQIPKGQGQYKVWYIDYSTSSTASIRSLGKTAVVQTPNGKLLLFAHLSSFGPGAKPIDANNPIAVALAKHHLISGGSFSTSGGKIGVSGYGGDGPHLHVAADPGAVQFLQSIDPSGFSSTSSLPSAGGGASSGLSLTPWESANYANIAAIAQKKGVPVEAVLAALQLESSGGMNRAAGVNVMQIDPASGLPAPANATQSLQEGAGLLAKLYKQYGSWQLAFQHYNGSGPKAVAYGKRAAAIMSQFQAQNGYGGGTNAPVQQVADPTIKTPKEKGGWWGAGGAPTTPGGWSDAWGAAASNIDTAITNAFGPNIDITKLSPSERTLLRTWVIARAKDQYQQTKSFINQTVPGGVNSPAGRDLLREAQKRVNQVETHPFAGYSRSDPWLQHMTKALANEQGQYSALSDKWSGVDPTTLGSGQRAQWLKDQYRKDNLWREIHDNIARIQYHAHHISKNTLDAKLNADKYHTNVMNQNARRKADGDLGPVGRVAAERVVSRCEAEARANVIRTKQQKAAEHGAKIAAEGLVVQRKTLAAIRDLKAGPHTGSKQSATGKQRAVGEHVVSSTMN